MPDKVLLYKGVADGVFTTNEPDFLILPYGNPNYQPASERERFYGGTSNHWGGQSRPEDPIDLEERRPGSSVIWTRKLITRLRRYSRRL
ncbi:MAG TPA: hypothetical protein VI031_06945 [Pyrinomonadaceae bacterium]